MKKTVLALIFVCITHLIDAQSIIDTSLFAQELKEFNTKLSRATAAKDSLLLERLVSKSFIRIHGTNGGFEERSSWINGILKGSQSTSEAEETAFEKLIKYPTATTAIEQVIVRRRTAKDGREIWLRRSNVYAKENSEWMLVQTQGTLMYD